MIVHDVEQGTDEWHDLRRGIVTASSVGQLLTVSPVAAVEFGCPTCAQHAGALCVSITKTRLVTYEGKPATPLKNVHPARAEAARQSGLTVIEPARTPDANSLTMLLAAERITGWTEETFVSADMWRGIEDELRARAEYARRYTAVQECGFITERFEPGAEGRVGFTIGYSPDGLVGDDGLIEIKSRRPKAQLQRSFRTKCPAPTMHSFNARC
jgi:hypothetical protein